MILSHRKSCSGHLVLADTTTTKNTCSLCHFISFSFTGFCATGLHRPIQQMQQISHHCHDRFCQSWPLHADRLPVKHISVQIFYWLYKSLSQNSDAQTLKISMSPRVIKNVKFIGDLAAREWWWWCIKQLDQSKVVYKRRHSTPHSTQRYSHCPIAIIANNCVHLSWELSKQIGDIIDTNVMVGWRTTSPFW